MSESESKSEPITEPTTMRRDEAPDRLRRAGAKADRGEIGLYQVYEIEPGWIMFDSTAGDFPRGITLRVEEVDIPGKRVRVTGGDKYGVKWVPAENLRSISDVSMEAYGTEKSGPGVHDVLVGIKELKKRPS